MDLGVTVLASLGSRHVDDLARTTLDDDVAVLSEGRALHGEGIGGTSISLVVDLELRGGRLVSITVTAPDCGRKEVDLERKCVRWAAGISHIAGFIGDACKMRNA